MPASRALRDRAAPDPRAGIVAAIAVVGLAVGVWLAFGTPYPAVGAFGAYYLWTLTIPGTIVHKAARGSMGSWITDLGLGTVTGLCLELLAWAAFSLADLREWLVVWPVLVLPLLALRSTRARVLQRPNRPWPWRASLLLAASIGSTIVHLGRTYLNAYDVPPGPRTYYIDLPWHMALVSEAKRALPLITPQLVDEGPVRYSWFVHAHLASASWITGIDVPTLTLRLWPLPMAALALIAAAALGERVSGRPWVGVLSAWMFMAQVPYSFWPAMTGQFDTFTPVSPTLLYSFPISILLVHLLSDIVRRGVRVGSAVLVLAVLVGFATTGTKSSAMAVVLAGILVVGVMSFVLRQHRRVCIVLAVGGLLLEVFTLFLVSGGGYGTTIQIFSALTRLQPYRQIVNVRDFSTLFPIGLPHTPGAGWILFVSLVLATLVHFARQLSFLFPLFIRSMRLDLAAWLMAGSCAGAWAPFLVMGHHGYSEYYFMRNVIPFGSVLASWALAELINGRRVRAVAAAVAGAVTFVPAAIGAVLTPQFPQPQGKSEWITAITQFSIQVSIGAAIVIVLGLACWILHRRKNLPVSPVWLAVLIAPVIATSVTQDIGGPSTEILRRTVAVTETSLAESNASVWISDNVPPLDLTATNAQCRHGQGMKCDASSWWVSGLGGRRVLLEGWSYTAQGANGTFDNTALYDFNKRLFQAPTKALVGEARRRGVRWLVAARLSRFPVSERLGEFADKRYDNGAIAIYELT